ncbi:MAG: hypothetical protein ACKVQC_05680 [Elusimicrobiota bacterium]
MKIMASFLAFVILFTHVLFAHSVETNLWTERQKSVRTQEEVKNTQLASLPAQFHSSSNVFNDLPSISKPLVSMERLMKDVPVGSENQYTSLIQSLLTPYGSIRKTTFPENQKQAKTIIHIQDVHLNDEAQQNIGKTLQSLIDQKKIDLVALEGAFGFMDFPAIRRFPFPDSTKAVADYLYKEKKISGAVYTAMTSVNEIPSFVGVDDVVHYNANVEAYKTSSLSYKGKKKQLEKMGLKINQQKNKVFNPELSRFDKEVQSYRQGKKDWGSYVQFLSEYQKDISTDVMIFLEALKQEVSLDFSKVESERVELLNQLVSTLSKNETTDLLGHSAAYKSGQIGHGDFYQYLKDLCHKKNVHLLNYKAMDAYIQYVLLSDGIQVDKILSEVASIEKSVYSSLAQTQEEEKIIQQEYALHLTQKLIDFSLTSEEWNDYSELKRSGIKFTSDNESESFSSFEKFYEEAKARDQVMSQNLIQEMDRLSAKVAVLVTGGFHSKGIDQELHKQGFTTITFTPKITKIEDDNGSSYLSVFSQEKTPLDKLFSGEKLFVTPKVMVDVPLAQLSQVLHHEASGTPSGQASRQGKSTKVTMVLDGFSKAILGITVTVGLGIFVAKYILTLSVPGYLQILIAAAVLLAFWNWRRPPPQSQSFSKGRRNFMLSGFALALFGSKTRAQDKKANPIRFGEAKPVDAKRQAYELSAAINKDRLKDFTDAEHVDIKVKPQLGLKDIRGLMVEFLGENNKVVFSGTVHKVQEKWLLYDGKEKLIEGIDIEVVEEKDGNIHFFFSQSKINPNKEEVSKVKINIGWRVGDIQIGLKTFTGTAVMSFLSNEELETFKKTLPKSLVREKIGPFGLDTVYGGGAETYFGRYALIPEKDIKNILNKNLDGNIFISMEFDDITKLNGFGFEIKTNLPGNKDIPVYKAKVLRDTKTGFFQGEPAAGVEIQVIGNRMILKIPTKIFNAGPNARADSFHIQTGIQQDNVRLNRENVIPKEITLETYVDSEKLKKAEPKKRPGKVSVEMWASLLIIGSLTAGAVSGIVPMKVIVIIFSSVIALAVIKLFYLGSRRLIFALTIMGLFGFGGLAFSQPPEVLRFLKENVTKDKIEEPAKEPKIKKEVPEKQKKAKKAAVVPKDTPVPVKDEEVNEPPVKTNDWWPAIYIGIGAVVLGLLIRILTKPKSLKSILIAWTLLGFPGVAAASTGSSVGVYSMSGSWPFLSIIIAGGIVLGLVLLTIVKNRRQTPAQKVSRGIRNKYKEINAENKTVQRVLEDIQAKENTGPSLGLRQNIQLVGATETEQKYFLIALWFMIKNRIGKIFGSVSEALSDTFKATHQQMVVVHVNNQNDLSKLDEVVSAGWSFKNENTSNVIVIGVVFGPGLSEGLRDQAKGIISKAPFAISMDELTPDSENNSVSYNQVFRAFADLFSEGSKERQLLLDLVIDQVQNKKVVVLGDSQIIYTASDKLLSILISLIPVQGGIMMIELQSVLEAAKNA